MHWLLSTVLLLALDSALPDAARGAISAFADRGAWTAALGESPDFTETFDEFTTDTSFQLTPLDLANFSLTQTPPNSNLFAFHNSVQVPPFPSGTTSENGFATPHLSLYVDGDWFLQVQMAFHAPIDAWGADYYRNPGSSSSNLESEIPQIQIHFEDGTQATIDLPYVDSPPGFFGILANGGALISDITLVGVANGNFSLGNRILMGDVSGRWGVVPEPSTGLLLITGLLGLAYRQRRIGRAANRTRA